MRIELRTLTPEDWQLWRSMRLTALAEAPDASGSRLADWADASENRWRERLTLPGSLNLVAVAGDTPLGMASGIPNPDDRARAELISMWVDPAARGKGVASALIAAVAEWAASAGAQTLTLSVMPHNDTARRTYERSGFVVSPEPGDPLANGEHEVIMELALGGVHPDWLEPRRSDDRERVGWIQPVDDGFVAIDLLGHTGP